VEEFAKMLVLMLEFTCKPS